MEKTEQQEYEGDDAGFRAAADLAGVFPGKGSTVDEAIEDAWSRVPDHRKRAGLRVEIRVVGENPINWYSVTLKA